MQLIDHFVGFM